MEALSFPAGSASLPEMGQCHTAPPPRRLYGVPWNLFRAPSASRLPSSLEPHLPLPGPGQGDREDSMNGTPSTPRTRPMPRPPSPNDEGGSRHCILCRFLPSPLLCSNVCQSLLHEGFPCSQPPLRMPRSDQQALSVRGLCGPLVLLALVSPSCPSPPPRPSRYSSSGALTLIANPVSCVPEGTLRLLRPHRPQDTCRCHTGVVP